MQEDKQWEFRVGFLGFYQFRLVEEIAIALRMILRLKAFLGLPRNQGKFAVVGFRPLGNQKGEGQETGRHDYFHCILFC